MRRAAGGGASVSEIKPPLNLLIDIQAWKEATATLTAAERGAFLALKMYYWRTGPIVDNDQTIAQITGMELKDWKKARKALEPLFIVGGGEWLRIDWNDELEAAYRAASRARDKGKKAVTARWDRQKAGQVGHSPDTPSIPQVFPMNTTEIVNYREADKVKSPSQQKDGFDYDDPAIDQLVSGLEAGWKNQPSIMAGGFGAVEAEKGADYGL